MLRVHFTDEDLARVEMAADPDPLWETVLAMHQLTAPGRVPRVFTEWRRRTRTALAGNGGAHASLGMLHALAASHRYFPDFLTPAAAAGGLASGLDALRGTPRERLTREIRRLARQRYAGAPVPGWMRELAAGDRSQRDALAGAVRDLYRAAVLPQWDEMAGAVSADRAARVRAADEGGPPGLLASLRPVLRWEAPTLVATYPSDRDLYLAGRGLRLIPSYFCWAAPVALADDDLRPVLVYPVHPPVVPSAGRDGVRREAALIALLGRNRARVIAALREAATTGELARSLRLSPASASEHVGVLRTAGLVCSHRTGNRVLHSLTPLGTALLTGRSVLPYRSSC